MGENNIYTYDGSSWNAAATTAANINNYTIKSSPYVTASIDETWLKEEIDALERESLKDVELPEDKTSVDLAKLTSEVIIKFLRSPEGISLLANELDKYFKK
jgi:hypothetical protein